MERQAGHGVRRTRVGPGQDRYVVLDQLTDEPLPPRPHLPLVGDLLGGPVGGVQVLDDVVVGADRVLAQVLLQRRVELRVVDLVEDVVHGQRRRDAGVVGAGGAENRRGGGGGGGG